MLLTVLGYLGAAVAGGLVSLKVIAPSTKTKKDDKVLEVLERVDTALKIFGPVVKK